MPPTAKPKGIWNSLFRLVFSIAFLHFLIIGLGVMIVGLFVLSLLVEVAGFNPNVAKGIELVISIQLNLIGNHFLTYRHRTVPWQRSFVRINMLRLATAGLSWGIFAELHSEWHLHYLVASFISVVAATFINFLAGHYWGYQEPGPRVRETPRQARIKLVARVITLVFALGFAWMMLGSTGSLYAVIVLAVAMSVFVAASSLWLSLYAWHTPEHMEHIGFDTLMEPQIPMSLVVPARKANERVFRVTVQALLNQTHPNFQIILVVSGDGDDQPTRLVAEALHHENPNKVAVIYVFGENKNKPKALVAARPHCEGHVIGLIDVESIAAAELLAYVDTLFVTTGADVVQGGVQLMDYNRTWYSLLNGLEYYKWFKSRLHWQANQGFITLGGNTVFIRAEALDDVGGWDPNMLTEDADLGVRMSVAGYKTVVAYDPRLATREEAPGTIRKHLYQRERWNQGFSQIYRKGDWRMLGSLWHRLLARYSLLMPRLQAAFGLLLPLAFVETFFIKLPTVLAMVTFLPMIPLLATMAADLVALREFGEDYGLKITWKHRLWLIIGTVPYQLMLSVAAVMAVSKEIRGINEWNLTEHSGAHLTESDTAPIGGTSA